MTTCDTRATGPLYGSQAFRVGELVAALSMTVGRGKAARLVAGLADLRPGERLLDVGCGPGTAVRTAAACGAVATGVDPSHLSLSLARAVTVLRRRDGIAWLEGSAERLPVPDCSAEVLWVLSSVHHWSDKSRGLEEALRVLVPGGRLLLAERAVEPQARGHARHGLTTAESDQLLEELSGAGFVEVRRESARAGHRKLTILKARRAAA